MTAALDRRDYRGAITKSLSHNAKQPSSVVLDEGSLDAMHTGRSRNRFLRAPAQSRAEVLHELQQVSAFLRRVGVGPVESSLAVVFGDSQGPPSATLQFLPLFAGVRTLLLNLYYSLAEALPRAVRTLGRGDEGRSRPRLALLSPQAHVQAACSAIEAVASELSFATLVVITARQSAPPPCAAANLTTSYAALLAEGVAAAEPCCGDGLLGDAGSLGGAPRLAARQDDEGQLQLVEYGADSRSGMMGARSFSRDHWRRQHLTMNLLPASSGEGLEQERLLLHGSLRPTWAFGYARIQAFSSLLWPHELHVTPPQLRWLREEWALRRAVHCELHGQRRDGCRLGKGLRLQPLINGSLLNKCTATGGGISDDDLLLLTGEAVGCPMVLEVWGTYETMFVGYRTPESPRHLYTLALGSHIGIRAWTIRSFGPYEAEAGIGQLLIQPAIVNPSRQVDGVVDHKHARKGSGGGAVGANGGDVPGGGNAGSGGRFEGKWYALRDIVQVIGGSAGNKSARVSMIDKITFPFRLSSGEWVATGRVEAAIQAVAVRGTRVVALAWACPAEGGSLVAAVVWPTDEYAEATEAELSEMVRDGLRATPSVRKWEVPSFVVLADEPWEHRPRAKVRTSLAAKFAHAVESQTANRTSNSIARTATTNLSIQRNAEWSSLLRRELREALDGATYPDAAALLIDAMAGCARGGCLLRNPDGSLREPERRHVPYSPQLPLRSRLDRYDDEPWHVWDLAQERGTSPAQALAPLRSLCADAHALERLRGALPAVVPNLGILHKLGIRFRLRLYCACALATQGHADIFAHGATSASVYAEVMRVCRPEWAIST